MDDKTLRPVIVGGSIAGLSAGIALISCGWDVVILERSESLLDAGAGLGIDENVIKAIKSLSGNKKKDGAS
jgi:2-polyprenyl-6-methoxyphenol hydroxylase-like FAD-dependent oxidoreductase